ncbi:hypothetical protein RSWS8N_07035 [Cereibacter sphaeroides WS8N]|nr:hypothetical protein RSWS8N_07035 [Cereibacter sphaeroides WS8N]
MTERAVFPAGAAALPVARPGLTVAENFNQQGERVT